MSTKISVPMIFLTNKIAIKGIPFFYNFRELKQIYGELDQLEGATAILNCDDIRYISVIVPGRIVRLPQFGRRNAEDHILIVQEDFWHSYRAKLVRTIEGSKRYNDDQKWFEVCEVYFDQGEGE